MARGRGGGGGGGGGRGHISAVGQTFRPFSVVGRSQLIIKNAS